MHLKHSKYRPRCYKGSTVQETLDTPNDTQPLLPPQLGLVHSVRLKENEQQGGPPQAPGAQVHAGGQVGQPSCSVNAPRLGDVSRSTNGMHTGLEHGLCRAYAAPRVLAGDLRDGQRGWRYREYGTEMRQPLVPEVHRFV